MIKIAAARARDKKTEQIPKKRKGTPKGAKRGAFAQISQSRDPRTFPLFQRRRARRRRCPFALPSMRDWGRED